MDARQNYGMRKPMACNLADQRKGQASTSILLQLNGEKIEVLCECSNVRL